VEARKRHIYVGFTLCTNTKFSTLKALIRPLLAKHHAWIYQHLLAYNKLDLVPLGFITKTNPRFHSLARLADEIRDVIRATFPHLSGAILDDNLVDPPIALLAPANINSGDERTHAMEIRVKRVHVSAMKCLLEQVYAIVPLTTTESKFIPYSLKHESQDAYRFIIRSQHDYLETHRNIPLAGITNDQMYEMIISDKVHRTPYDILSKLPGITRLDTTALYK
jgi:hypothetical protein